MKWFEFGAACLFILASGYVFIASFEEFWYGQRPAEHTPDEALVPEWARETFEAIDQLPETAGTEA